MTLFVFSQGEKYVTVKKSFTAMGSIFDITVISLDEELGYIYIHEGVAEVQRIEKLISSWDNASETTKINTNAGIKPVAVSWELFKLIERSVQISEITNGAFDISYTPLEKIWKFDGSMNSLPTKGEIKETTSKTGYQNIILNSKNQSVYLNKKGMRISFGGIGKGFAADKVKALLISKQVKAGIINIGGDITTWGTKATGEKWLIGIVNPERQRGLFSWLPILESSVATSGGNTDFMLINDKKYTHVLDPRTGYPSIGINSVSVFAKSAEFSDALATSIFVMGVNAGLALINQLGDTEVIIVNDVNKMYKSNGIILN
ncbi:FAD:protein FMN transferase [Maribacter sp. ACAM166]|uniref:FAD:protein FMN transferase n=1 Tax=Maribacter sp. ACAM166 TaxID=2508996 RepID=UPI0020171DC3|nr:FAD:protein FMN transferase [Maribacter sp. ACAM166]